MELGVIQLEPGQMFMRPTPIGQSAFSLVAIDGGPKGGNGNNVGAGVHPEQTLLVTNASNVEETLDYSAM